MHRAALLRGERSRGGANAGRANWRCRPTRIELRHQGESRTTTAATAAGLRYTALVVGHSQRRTVAFAAVLGLVGLAWLPPAHVHRRVADDHHEAEVVHRHIGWHQAVPSPTDIDHPDHEDALYINDVFTIARSAQSVDAGHVLAVAIDGLGISSAPPVHSPLSAHTLRTHDPPWRSSSALRGPPVFPA